jgi:hypothetical protein
MRPGLLAAFGLNAILALLASSDARAAVGDVPIFTRTFLSQCRADSVRARLSADGVTVRYWIDGYCPGTKFSGELAFRSGLFSEVFDLGTAGVLRSKGNCSDNPWTKAARCENVSIQGDGPQISALLAEHPYTPTGDLLVPLTLNAIGSDAFRKAHATAERPNPPNAPVAVRVAQPLGSDAVHVSWIAPDESGDRPYVYFLAQARPRALEGAAWVEVGKVGRGTSAAYTAPIRLPPPVRGTNGWDVRMCSATALAVTCSAWLTPSSVAGNAVLVRPNLNLQQAQNGTASLVGRAGSNTQTGATMSTCERAAAAQARNSPAAAALAAKCRAEGGPFEPGPTAPVPENLPDLNALAVEGAALAAADVLATSLRESLGEGEGRRGFDIAMAAAQGQTEWGPGKQKILESLSGEAQMGFKTAISYLFDLNRYVERARIGLHIAELDPEVAEHRSADGDARFTLGFDIASAIFGDSALGAQGNTAAGPGSLGIRNSLSAPAQRGFDAAMKFHLSRN